MRKSLIARNGSLLDWTAAEPEPQAAQMKRRASNAADRECGKLIQRLGAALGAIAIASSLLAGCTSRLDRVRINQAQVIGTHNSYHLRGPESLLGPIAQQAPDLAQGLEYSHRPLPEQSSRLGIRQIELDCFVDPEGGRYAEPRGPKLAAALGKHVIER